MTFTLTNTFNKKILLSLEPEGTIFELLAGQSIEIELSSGSGPVIDLQLQEYEGDICIAIWPCEGMYRILE